MALRAYWHHQLVCESFYFHVINILLVVISSTDASTTGLITIIVPVVIGFVIVLLVVIVVIRRSRSRSALAGVVKRAIVSVYKFFVI